MCNTSIWRNSKIQKRVENYEKIRKMKLLKLKIGFLTMACASMFLVSCGGTQKEVTEVLEIRTEQIISDTLSRNKEYYNVTADNNQFWKTWLTFKGSTVVFTIVTQDYYTTFGRNEIMGKYNVVDNKGVYTIDLDFGSENIEVATKYSPKKYLLPKFLEVELDSLNHVVIKGWEIVNPDKK